MGNIEQIVRFWDFEVSSYGKIALNHMYARHIGLFRPEYFPSSQYTKKKVMFIVFKLCLSSSWPRQKPLSSLRSQDMGRLASLFLSVKKIHLFNVLDPQVAAEGEKEELENLVNLTSRCVNLKGRKRSTMAEVSYRAGKSEKASKSFCLLKYWTIKRSPIAPLWNLMGNSVRKILLIKKIKIFIEEIKYSIN